MLLYLRYSPTLVLKYLSERNFVPKKWNFFTPVPVTAGAPTTFENNLPEIGVEHLSKDCRHKAVDEEVYGGVDDHEELRDDAPEERPHADAVALVLHVLDELLYRENLRKGSVGTIAFDRKLAKPLQAVIYSLRT